jgi:predicted kinase
MPKTLFILCAEAFSGKTTLAQKIAERYGAKIVGRDLIYFAIMGLLETDVQYDDTLWEKDLWPVAMHGVRNHLNTGVSVVFDDCSFLRKQRDELRSIARACGAHSVLIYLDVPQEVLKARKKQNKITKERHDVSSVSLEEDNTLFERPTEDEKPLRYLPDSDLEAWFKKLDERIHL